MVKIIIAFALLSLIFWLIEHNRSRHWRELERSRNMRQSPDERSKRVLP